MRIAKKAQNTTMHVMTPAVTMYDIPYVENCVKYPASNGPMKEPMPMTDSNKPINKPRFLLAPLFTRKFMASPYMMPNKKPVSEYIAMNDNISNAFAKKAIAKNAIARIPLKIKSMVVL